MRDKKAVLTRRGTHKQIIKDGWDSRLTDHLFRTEQEPFIGIEIMSLNCVEKPAVDFNTSYSLTKLCPLSLKRMCRKYVAKSSKQLQIWRNHLFCRHAEHLNCNAFWIGKTSSVVWNRLIWWLETRCSATGLVTMVIAWTAATRLHIFYVVSFQGVRTSVQTNLVLQIVSFLYISTKMTL